MGEWVEKQVSQIGKVVSGATPSTARNEFWNGQINWITPTDLSKSKTPFVQKSERLISELGLQNCSAQLIPAGNLVLSSRAPIGYFAIVQNQFTTNQGCKSIIFDVNQNSIFHYYNFLFRVDKFKEKGEGTTFAEISKREIEKLVFQFPESFEEQSTIALILSTIDQAIEKTERLIAKYERIKTGLMQDLLTRGIDEQGRIRSEETHVFKDSPLGRVPVEWEVVSAKNLSKRVCVGFVGTCEKYYTNPSNGIPMIRTGNLQNGELNLSELKYVTFDFHISNKKSQLHKGDILVARHGESGQAVLFNTDIPEANCLNIVIIRPDFLQITSKYFRNYLNSETVKRQVENKKGGTTQSVVNTKEIENLLVAFPKRSEQERIDSILNIVDRYMGGEKNNLIKLKKQKTALMQDLLTGKVRVDALIK